MKRYLLIVLFVLAIASPVFAQEETPAVTETATAEVTPIVEPTAVPTEEPAPVDPIETTRDLTTIISTVVLGIVGGFVAGGLTVGGILLMVVRSFNAASKDAARRLFYSTLSPEMVALIRGGLLGADELIEFGKEITTPPAS